MSVLVKTCGLKNTDDVSAAVAAGTDAVGFVFAESPRRVTPAQAAAACTNLPAGIRRVAVMLHPSQDELQAVLEEFEPDVLQTDIADLDGLDLPNTVTIWPVVREGQAGKRKLPDTFLYEGAKSGAGHAVNWDRAARLANEYRMILAGGLNAENVATAINTVQPWAVDASSGLESEPGCKDPERIKQFVKAVRAAEKTL